MDGDKKKKITMGAGAVLLAALVLLGGTFAWQSISQMALNENAHEINPGARLHDDYDGTNGIKRVYVENFAEDDVSIIARVRLDEYMEIGATAGHKKDVTEETANGNFIAPYENGSVTVTESVNGSGDVTLTIETLPYKGYETDSVKVGGSALTAANGVYTYTQTSGSAAVTVEVTFKANIAYSGVTIAAPKPLDTTADINNKTTWTTYIPKTDSATGAFVNDNTSAFRKYVTLTLGSNSNVSYMPTFNKNKDSLKADINGTYEGKGLGTPFDDYVDYSLTANQKKTADAEYDIDHNTIDEATPQVGVNIKKVSEEHQVKTISAAKSKVISMQQWKDTYKMAPGDYWIYDTDGWAYWGNLLESGDADNVTGLLLSGNKMTGVPEDNWYYGMNVVAQFVTPEDLGKSDNTGFYTETDEKPSDDAEKLLALLGAGKTLDVTTGEVKNGVLNIANGDTAVVSAEKLDTTVTRAMTWADTKWWSTNEDIITVVNNNDGTATVTAKKVGEAYVIYSGEQVFASMKVKATAAPYELTSATLEAAKTKGIVMYTDTDQKAELVITGEPTSGTDAGMSYEVSIADSLFANNTDLTSVVLKDGVVSVGKYAFLNCTNVNKLILPETTLTTVGLSAFNACMYDTLKIPKSIKNMGNDAFSRNTVLKSVELEEGLEILGTGAFCFCTGLKSIYLPESLNIVGDNVFLRVPVAQITIADGNESLSVNADKNILYNKDQTELIWYSNTITDSTFTVPSSVKTIRNGAFREQKYLTEVIIGAGVETIGIEAFFGCSNLTKADIPDSVTSIGYCVFSATTKMTEITLLGNNKNYEVVDGMLYDKNDKILLSCPGGKNGTITIQNGTKEIAKRAFRANTIDALVIPASVQTIDSDALSVLKGTLNIKYTGTQAQWDASSFKDLSCFDGKTIECDYVPES